MRVPRPGSLSAAAVLTACLLVPAGTPAQVQDTVARAGPARLHGAWGLNVALEADSIVVRWLTREAGPGFAEVWRDGHRRAALQTPADTAHRAAFERPGGRQLLLRFGGIADEADRQEVLIDTEPPDRRRTVWPAADSIFVISDVHGEFDRLTAVLQNAGLIDRDLRWVGGRRHLVVLGDMVDRGADVTRTLWFLYDLERQAGRRDGPVHILLGNHEIMVMLEDLRYVSQKENDIARLYGESYARLFHPRTSVIGRWLAARPAAIRIGDALFAHGGVSSDYAGWRIEQVDDSLAAFTGEELFARWNDSTYLPPLDTTGWYRRWDFFWDDRSIFWYRGYVTSDTTEAELDTVLRAWRSRLMVVGHTPGDGIRERFGGRLIAVNTDPFAAEALLLVRRDDAWDRQRIGEAGPAVPLESGQARSPERAAGPGPPFRS